MSAARGRSRARRKAVNVAFAAVCLGASLASVAILGVLLVTIVNKGLTYLDGDFLTTFASRREKDAGLKAALWGSVWLCVVCAVSAVPLGVGTAVFLEEYRPKKEWLRRLHGIVEINIANLAGVPSIVYGILGLTVLARMFGVFGAANVASYDEMLRVTMRDGSVIQAERVDEDDARLMLSHPIRGEFSVEKKDVRSSVRVYAKAHEATLTSGEKVRGELSATDDSSITMFEPGVGERVLRRAEIASFRSINAFQIGDPDSLFYFRLPLGGSVLAGGLTLGLVVLPIVIVATRESLRAVPGTIREAATALGATKWQCIRGAVLPSAVPGIMTGAILAMSRAMGEAAPLLVLGGFIFVMFTPRNVMDDFTAMPLQIYNWATRPQEGFHEVAASGIIVLLGVLVVFNAAAIVVRQWFQRRTRA